MHPPRLSSRSEYVREQAQATFNSTRCTATNQGILIAADNTGNSVDRQSLHPDHANLIASDGRPLSSASSSFSSVALPVVVNPNEVICAPLEPPPRNANVAQPIASSIISRLAHGPASQMIVSAVPAVRPGAGAIARSVSPIHANVKTGPFAVSDSTQDLVSSSSRAFPATTGASTSDAVVEFSTHQTIASAPTSRRQREGTANASITPRRLNNNNGNIIATAQYIRRPMVAPNPSLATVTEPAPSYGRGNNVIYNPAAILTSSTRTNENTKPIRRNPSEFASHDKDEQGCLYNCHYSLFHTLAALFARNKK
jgi:hypothetical protein